MASITKILGTDGIKKSRVTLNDNFAAINQQVTEIAELLDGFEGSGSGFTGGLVAASIIPDQDEIHDLGTPDLRFRDLYLSNNTIYLGENSISMANGNMLVNGNQLITNSRLLEEVAERARLLGIETTSRNQAISSVTSQLTSLANENEAIAETLTNLNTSFDNEILTAVGAETLARTTAISGINQTLTSLSNANAATAQSVTDLGTAFTADIAAAVGAETSARTTAISGINQTLTSISNANQAIAQSVTDLGSSFTSDIEDAVGAETSARTAAISDINQTLTSLSNANEATAESVTNLSAAFTTDIAAAVGIETAARTAAVSDINQTLTSITNANEATAQSVTNLSTSFTSEITGAISTEALARQNALAAEVLARATAIQNAVNLIPDPTGFATTEDLEAEATSRVSAIAAEAAERARLLGIETTARTTAISGINQTLTTLNDANSATAQSVTNLSASFASDLADLETDQNLLRTNAIAGVESSISALTTANEAIALSVTNLGTQFETDIDAAITGEAEIRALAITNIGEQISSLSNGDGATATRLNTLEAQYTVTDGTITGFSQSSALKTVIDSAIATANQATVTSTTDLIAELGEQTAGVTQSMSADINALTNKVNAQYTLEVNADGNVAGMRLGADETGSSIAFTADSFKVSSGGPNGELLTPFSIVNGQVAFNGAVSFSSGATGPAGPAGPQGAAGTNGLNGLDGSDGLPGVKGADGVSTYFHVAYADNASGGGFSQNPTGKLYIGTYVDTTAADAASGSNLWKWQLVKGADGTNGENGIAGTNGVDGQTTYLHIAYANNATGTSGFSTTVSTDKLYLGTYTDFTLADSTNPALYNWTLIKGADGINGLDGSDGLPGVKGADGVSTYFHVAYADNATGGGFSQSAAGKLYIGTYVDTTAADAASGSNLWKWQLVKGADGTNGENGIAGTNGVDGQTSYLHIAYATNATGTTGFHLSESLNKTYLGTYTDFTEADSTNPALYTWTLIKGADGRDGVDGADGADGSDGANARAVNLTCTDQVFVYNTAGLLPLPINTLITATALNTTGTVYYQFFKNDVAVQNTDAATYAYTPQSNFTNMPDKIEVQIREGSSTGTVKARDQITMAGIKPGANGSNGTNGADGYNGVDGVDGTNGIDGAPGTDGMTVLLSNEAHTLPTTNAGVVTYTGSGTTIRLYEGATELVYDGSGLTNGKWTLTRTGSSITSGSITDSGNYATIGDHSNMTANIASITYTISGKRASGASFTFTKTQSFAKSIQGANGVDGADGADGSAGANARAVNLTCANQVFTYNSSGLIPSPVNTVITATPINTSGTVWYQFFKNDVSVQNYTYSTYTYTPQSNFTSMPDKIEVQIREGGSTGTVLARDQITMSGIKPGANGSNGSNGSNGTNGVDGVNGIDGAPGTDGMTVIVSNEAHTLPTTSGGVVTYTGSGTTIRVFEGATELNYSASATSEGVWTISGVGSSITVGSITDSGTYATVNNHSNMTANTASITYTISGYRASGGYFTFTKTQSFAKSIQGATGPQGPAPDTSQYLTTSTTIDGGKITTGIIKNGNFVVANSSWNTYSTAGMGINLDQGAINAKNFYIAPDGTAAFKGDIDVTSGATVGGSPMNDFFEVGDVIEAGTPRRVLKMRDDAYLGTVKFSGFRSDFELTRSDLSTYRNDFNLIADDYVNRFTDYSDPRDPGTGGEMIQQQTTLSHMYVKRNDVVLEIGDLVKLDENNELVKASSAKDKTIVGILWQEVDFSIKESPLDKFIIGGKDTSEKDYHYRDSFGNKIPSEDRDQKSIWKVASLGDSFDAGAGLQGMKVCNQNGPVVKGDLLCSSDVPGYAMKQPVEYVIIGFNNEIPQYEERQTINSYTLGKCMETCTFDGEGKATGIYGYLYCG